MRTRSKQLVRLGLQSRRESTITVVGIWWTSPPAKRCANREISEESTCPESRNNFCGCLVVRIFRHRLLATQNILSSFAISGVYERRFVRIECLQCSISLRWFLIRTMRHFQMTLWMPATRMKGFYTRWDRDRIRETRGCGWSFQRQHITWCCDMAGSLEVRVQRDPERAPLHLR